MIKSQVVKSQVEITQVMTAQVIRKITCGDLNIEEKRKVTE